MSRNITGTRHRRFQLNPSFAAAHGLSKKKDGPSTIVTVKDDEEANVVQNIVFKGRKSGKVTTTTTTSSSSSNHNVTISLFQIQKCWQEEQQQQSKIIDYSNPTSTEYNYVWEEITMVDLSFCNLSITDGNSSFQDFLQSLPMLQTLRLRHSNLQNHVDLSVYIPTNLSILDMSGNQISSITLSSSNNNLKEINLSRNQLQSWNTCNGKIIMNKLCVLNVQENETLHDLPLFEQQSLKQLQQLYASHTSISILPSCYVVSKQLQIVDLSHSKLQQISSSLYHCSMLQELNLSYNELSSIPTLPTSIIQCRLEYNQITTIDELFVPKEHQRLYDKLKELHLDNNLLTDISNVKWNEMAPSLHTLDLRNNDIEIIPSSNFVGLTRLKKLYICGNPIINISPPFLIHDVSQCTKLIAKLQQEEQQHQQSQQRPTTILKMDEILRTKHLQIVQQPTNEEEKLSSIFEHSQTWHDLELLQNKTDCMKILRLTISNQSMLESVKDWFFKFPNENDDNNIIFPNIREIAICQNHQLSTLPSDLLGWYAHCHTLHLHSNQLSKTTIHSIFNNHSNTTTMLKDVDLSGNKLHELPSGLLSNHYINLERLNVSYNQLSSLNLSTTASATNLRHLIASNNRLKEISNISKATCPKLQSLHLENNQLMTIPLELGNLNATLQILSLHGNPQRMIRTAILEKGCQAVLSYLQQKQTNDDDCIALNENKTIKCFTFKNYDHNQRQQQMTTANNSSNQNDNISTIQELKEHIEQLTLQMKKDNHKLSQAQKYAFKKNLAVQKAKLIKEERKLKQQQS